jgi:hypothetical protein
VEGTRCVCVTGVGFPICSDHLPARQVVFQTCGGATRTSANVRVSRKRASVPPEKRASFVASSAARRRQREAPATPTAALDDGIAPRRSFARLGTRGAPFIGHRRR